MADGVVVDGVIYKLVGNRVRDKHGRFVTIEELKAQQAEEKARVEAMEAPRHIKATEKKLFGDKWIEPQVLHELGENRLVRIANKDDLVLLGHLVPSCVGSHGLWVAYHQIWHVLTVMDKNNVPHTTLLLQDREWYDKDSHPDDRLSYPVIKDSVTYSRGYALSIYYKQHNNTPYTGEIRLNNKIVKVSHGTQLGSFAPIYDEWYKANRIGEPVGEASPATASV